jgi:hypothetical protein
MGGRFSEHAEQLEQDQQAQGNAEKPEQQELHDVSPSG